MNIIDTEDMIKGLPDAALQKEAQNPSGQAPQFLVVSEIKRRKDMRERYAQNQQSQGTVKDQLLGMNAPSPQPQVASMGQPQGRPMPPMGGQMPMGQPPMQQPAPPMGMYGGGVIRMAEGLTVPQTREEQLALLAELPGGLEAIDQLGDRITGITPEERELLFNRLSANGDIIQNPSPIPYGDEFLTDEQLAVNSSTITPERIQGLQFPSGVSGFEPSNTTPQGYDQARMIAEQTARLNQAQSIKDSQAQSVQPPPNETVAKLRDENRNPNQMSLDEVRKIPGYENMEMNEERTVNRTLNIFPRTPPEVSEQIKALFRNNKPVEAQELANQYKPEPQRDPYVAMQGDLIKMPEQRPVGIEQLVAAGTNGVGMSGVGADIKAGMGQQNATPVVSTSEMSLLDRVLGRATPAPLSDEQKEANRRRVATAAVSSQSRSPYSPSRSDTSAKDFAPFEENRKAAYEEMLDRMEQSGVSMDTFALTNPAIRGYAEEFGIPLSAEEKKRMEDVLAFKPSSMESLIDTSQRQLDVIQNPSNSVKADANRLDPSKLDEDTLNAALNAKVNPYSTAYNVNVGTNSASEQGDNERQGRTSTDKSVQGSLDDITDRTEGEEGSEYKIPTSLEALRGEQRRLSQGAIESAEELRAKEESYKDLLENRKRPTLSYADLIRESEQSMATQLADIKTEKGSQALIALGAGIASGDLGKGLSDAGKAVAKTNAQKRALEARQQAVRMGFRKSEVDSVYQNQIAKEGDKLESMKFDIDSLRKLNVSKQAAEQSVLNFDSGLEKTIATLEQSREFKLMDKAKQDSLNRRAALDFVTDSMREMQLINKSEDEIARIQNVLLGRAASALEIDIATLSAAGATGTATSGTTTIGGYSVTKK